MQTVYDKVPYPSYSFVQSHPDHLATLATLLGMEPPPVERSRVLELGCASGGNLIPMAYGLPGSEFPAGGRGTGHDRRAGLEQHQPAPIGYP